MEFKLFISVNRNKVLFMGEKYIQRWIFIIYTFYIGVGSMNGLDWFLSSSGSLRTYFDI